MSIPAREDMDDLHRALVAADALASFERLPLAEQERFMAWIAKARDDEAYWRRIDILVLGMRMAPPSQPQSPPERSGFWTNPLGQP